MAFTYALSRVVCDIAAYAIPAYLAFKAIRNKSGRDITLWLVFFIVHSLFHLAEIVGDIFVFWFPFYYEIKMLFILWLILPQFQGHLYVFQRFVLPALNRYEPDIDLAIEQLSKNAHGTLQEWWQRLQAFMQGFISDVAQKSGDGRLAGARIQEIQDGPGSASGAGPAPPQDALQIAATVGASVLSSLVAAAGSLTSASPPSSMRPPRELPPRGSVSGPDASGYPGSTRERGAAAAPANVRLGSASPASSPYRFGEASVLSPSVASADSGAPTPTRLQQSYFSPQIQMETRYRGSNDMRGAGAPRSGSISTEGAPLPNQVPQRAHAGRGSAGTPFYDADGPSTPDAKASSFLDDEIRFEEDAFQVDHDFFKGESKEVAELSKNPWKWHW